MPNLTWEQVVAIISLAVIISGTLIAIFRRPQEEWRPTGDALKKKQDELEAHQENLDRRVLVVEENLKHLTNTLQNVDKKTEKIDNKMDRLLDMYRQGE